MLKLHENTVFLNIADKRGISPEEAGVVAGRLKVAAAPIRYAFNFTKRKKRKLLRWKSNLRYDTPKFNEAVFLLVHGTALTLRWLLHCRTGRSKPLATRQLLSAYHLRGVMDEKNRKAYNSIYLRNEPAGGR